MQQPAREKQRPRVSLDLLQVVLLSLLFMQLIVKGTARENTSSTTLYSGRILVESPASSAHLSSSKSSNGLHRANAASPPVKTPFKRKHHLPEITEVSHIESSFAFSPPYARRLATPTNGRHQKLQEASGGGGGGGLGSSNLVNALVNQTARLVCRPRTHLFQHSGEELRVTWVKDMELLSTGQSSFTTDTRIRPRHMPGSSEWWLEIDNVNPRDEGIYVCQVNSSPVIVAAELQLRVLEPQISIEGPEEWVREGSELRLTCQLSFKLPNSSSFSSFTTEETIEDATIYDETDSIRLPEDLARGVAGFNSGPPSGEWLYIYWFKDNVSLEQSGNSRRNAVRFNYSISEDVSYLKKTVILEDASGVDSGEYGCKLIPGELEPALLRIRVGAGATSAASPSSPPGRWILSLPMGVVLLFLVALINRRNDVILVNSLERNLNASQASRSTSSQQELPQPISESGHLHLGGKCGRLSSCSARGSWSDLNVGQEACYCDSKCGLYEDCCRDFNYTREDSLKRAKLKASEIFERRHKWYCLPVNEAFGSVLVRASCDARWPKDGLVARRCSYLDWLSKSIVVTPEQRREYFSDPVGMMLPITDLTSGITYANSYCLRCNKLGPKPNLHYWQPLLECNYLLDVDDRNALFDHISANQGEALEFSDTRGQWIVKAPPSPTSTSNATEMPPPPTTLIIPNGNRTSASTSPPHQQPAPIERSCQVMPTAPESAEQLLRYCHYPTDSIIDTCPNSTNNSSLSRRQRLECELGAQELVYNLNGDRLYLNTACARCNQEPKPVCKPYVERRENPLFVIKTVLPDSVASRGGQGGAGGGTSLSGSFSLLMDISGRSSGDNTVGQVHQCKDTEKQIYDPFYLACRDIICGFKAVFNGDTCEQLTDDTDRIQFQLVDKFNETMSMVSGAGLILSILALSFFLLLHWLSMFDLRSLLVRMAQAQASELRPGSPLERQRGSKASTSSTAARESLSSRGVACLAASLLIAYLFFLAGHQQLWPPSGWQCITLAAATYGSFLLAFNWMFLLSYDIWRTLRLATCRLRVPAAHAQSMRFLCYALLALFFSGSLVALALTLDLTGSSNIIDCSLQSQLDRWDLAVLQYKPNFGKRPGSCWFANRRSLALFFGAPITLITLLNLLFFLHTSSMVVRTSSRSSRRQHLSASVVRNAPTAESFVATQSLVARKNSQVSQDSFNDSSTSNNTSSSTCHSISYTSASAQSGASSSPGTLLMMMESSEGSSVSGSEKRKKRVLEPSNSSSSLTNQSLGGVSLATSLANKCDAQVAQLQSLASSLAKDYRLYCRLSTIMGLTWLTGLLASLVDHASLWYLFVVLNTLQGLFIFIAFGCKRSKLTNLLILVAYLRFMSLGQKGGSEPEEAPPATTDTKPPAAEQHLSNSLHRQQPKLQAAKGR